MSEKVEEACRKFLKLSTSKEAGDVISGLNLFLKQADLVDFIEQYVKVSRDCGELCTVLQWNKQQCTHNTLLVCFRCMEQVCLKSASTDASDNLKLAGHNLATNLISNHMKTFYSALSLSAPNVLTATTLRLLTALVAQGPVIAHELLCSFNFSYKPLEILPTKVGNVNKKLGSIRLCFIQFAVSFLVIGTNEVIQEFLVLKGFLNTVFMLLPNDSIEVVYLVLNALQEKVVENPNISKKVKSAFFTHTMLTKISSLLSKKEEIELNECVVSLADYCRDFILKLCTNFQLGICYKSKGIPSSWRRSNNPTLLQFLLSLKDANEEDSHQQQIVLATLKACPDLVISYLNGLSCTFEPKLSSKWISNVEFILQVYSSITDVPQILQHLTDDQLMSCIDTAVAFTAPPCVSRNVLSQGVQNASPLVKSTVISLLLMILKRSGDAIEWYSDTMGTTESIDDDFLMCYCDSVLKCLPDIKTIISLRQLLSNVDKLNISANAKNESLHKKHETRNAELVDGVLLREQSLEILCGYQRLSPDILSASGFDLTKLLPSVMTSDDLPENLLLVLNLLLGAPVGTLKWDHPKNHLLSSMMHIMYLESSDVATVASRVVKKLVSVLPICHSTEVDIMVTSLLSQLQCRIYSTDIVSSLIMTLVDGLKCLAKNPLQFMDCDSFSHAENDSITLLSQLESILASDLVLPTVSTEVVPPSSSSDSTALSSTLISPVWLMLIKQCSTQVLLLPLVTEVFLKVLLITDHPTVIADAVLHHLGNAMVTKEFQTSSAKWIHYDFMCHMLPWKSVRCEYSLDDCYHGGDEIQRPVKHIKKMLQSSADMEANLFEYLSQLPPMQLASLFPDVWKLCNKEWCDDHGSVFLQQYLNIRPLHITGEYSLSALTLLLQCLPKEPREVEDGSYKASKAKRKKLEASAAYCNASMQLRKLTNEKLDKIPQAISKSTCKEIFLVVQSLLKSTTPLYTYEKGEETISLLQQYYNLLRIIVEKVLSNKCKVIGDSLLVKCGHEECSCSFIINTVFNNSALKDTFLTPSPSSNPRLQQTSLVRKQKHVSQTKTGCSSLLVCDLITTCLKIQPQMIKVSCLQFYFDKIIEVLGVQDFSIIIASSAHKIFQQLASYMESKTVSVILDNILSNMVSVSDQLMKNNTVEILVSLRLQNHINYFTSSYSGFISLLSICISCNIDELDKLVLDILLVYINGLESKVKQPKDREMLACVSQEICQIVPSLSAPLLSCQSGANSDLLEAISTDIIMDWVVNPTVCRVSMVNLIVSNSKKHKEHFATTVVNCLSDNTSETNVYLYLPLFISLFKSLGCDQAKESMPKHLTKILWKYCSNQLITSSANQEICSHILIKLVELHKPGKKINKLFAKLKDLISSHSQLNNYQLAVVGKLISFMTEDNGIDTFLMYCMEQITNIVVSGGDTVCDEELVLTTMLNVLKEVKLTLVPSKWNSFIKLILKHRLHSTTAMNMLGCFIKQLYSNDNCDKIICIGDIYEMIWSHSQFLDIMLSPNEADNLVKEALVKLLLTTFDSNRCTKYHYAVLLAAYQPNMEITNQHIITLMHQYEIQGVDTSEFSPYLWGKTAVDQFKERQKKGWVLCKQPGMTEVLDMLDKSRVKQSTYNFPIDILLEPSGVHEHLNNGELKDLYDPRYLLPLFSHLLNTGNLINCRKFVSHGSAGYLVTALSSHNTDIRAAAYNCLSRFYVHLEGSRFREKDQILLLMDVLKNSITVENNRIPCVHSLFLCKCLEIFLTPGHDMYLVLANFMVYKPALDLQEVPMFYLLVHSSGNQHKLERLWIMSLLKEGLRSACDYPVYRKRNVIPILMAHYSSMLTDPSMKLQILLLIKQASLLDVVATDLVWNKGLLSWLHFVADDGNKVSLICEIVHNIWTTVGKVLVSDEPLKAKDTLDSDQLIDVKQKVHIPYIEHDIALLLLCLQQKLSCR